MFKQYIPLTLGVGCMFVYAFVIVMLKKFSAQYNVFVLCLSYLPFQFAIIIVFHWLSRMYLLNEKNAVTYLFPVGSAWGLIAVLGILFALGSTLNYQAYATGGSVQMMTGMTMLLPIFTTFITYFWERQFPNGWQLAAFGAGVLMIALLIKGIYVAEEAKKVAELAMAH